MQRPEGFVWGTGASSTQCEGAAPASDWWDSRYVELGLTHHRLSIEWSRIEPEPGHDAAAVAHYHDVRPSAAVLQREAAGPPR